MWKLLYTKMLGYDVEFGQRQAMDLIASAGWVLRLPPPLSLHPSPPFLPCLHS